ncbi:MAG: periplasmic heavy metal sensor [Calditrichaeota bacterium]|nr:MAG: periplasmic heavy metal sensor [Calditrichota bacterium]
MRGLKVVLAVALLLGFVVLVPAQMAVEKEVQMIEHDEEGEMDPGKMGPALGLTEEQRAKMMDLHLALQRELLPLKSKLHELKVRLKLKITSDDYSQKAVDQLLNQILDLEKQIQKKRIAHMRAVREMLTPEQRKKFDMAVLSGRAGKHGMHNRPRWMPMRGEHMQRRGRPLH